MTRIRYRKNQAPSPEWPRDPGWPVYDVEVQDRPRSRWQHAGRVARYGERDWAALGDGAQAWTAYHATQQAAVADMLAGRTFLDRERDHPGTGTGQVANRSARSGGDGGAASRVYERDGETYRAHRYQLRGGQALASADYIVRRDSDARYGGFITDTTRDGGQPPGDGYRFEVYDDSGRHLARTRSFRGALMVLAMPRRTRWISEHQPPDLGQPSARPSQGPGADAAWKDAYSIARAGASSPAGVRRAIAGTKPCSGPATRQCRPCALNCDSWKAPAPARNQPCSARWMPTPGVSASNHRVSGRRLRERSPKRPEWRRPDPRRAGNWQATRRTGPPPRRWTASATLPAVTSGRPRRWRRS